MKKKFLLLFLVVVLSLSFSQAISAATICNSCMEGSLVYSPWYHADASQYGSAYDWRYVRCTNCSVTFDETRVCIHQ